MKFLFSLAILVALIIAMALTSEAEAQVGPRPPPRYGVGFSPNLSPYLNLLRGGDQSANYFLGVLPEQQRRRDAATFREQTRELDIRTRDLEGEDRDIGTAADFGDTGSFFKTPATYYPKVGTLRSQPQSGRPFGR